jgi:endoribonuclease Dicer
MLREDLDVPNPPPELRVIWEGRISRNALQQPYVKNPVNNGVIRPQDATHVVVWLASTFRKADEQPLLRHVDAGGRHMYSVHLPGTLIEAVRGDVCDTLTEARRSACMRACQAICSRGMLDPCFYWTVGTDDKDQAGAPLAANKYHVKSVFFWENCLAIPGARRWYPTLLRSEEEGTASMLMLTAQPLPPLLPLKLYPAGQAVQIQLIRGSPFDLSEDQVHMLHRYTLRVHRMIVNKRLVCQLERTPYFLAPYSGASAPLDGDDSWPTLGEHISWKAVEQTATTWTTPLTLDDLTRDVNDLVIQDRSLEFAKRYFISRLRPDLNPTSKPAEGSVRQPRNVVVHSYPAFALARGGVSFVSGMRARTKQAVRPYHRSSAASARD